MVAFIDFGARMRLHWQRAVEQDKSRQCENRLRTCINKCASKTQIKVFPVKIDEFIIICKNALSFAVHTFISGALFSSCPNLFRVVAVAHRLRPYRLRTYK